MPAQGTAPLIAPERPIVPALFRVHIVANCSTKDRADARLRGPIRVRRHARERHWLANVETQTLRLALSRCAHREHRPLDTRAGVQHQRGLEHLGLEFFELIGR